MTRSGRCFKPDNLKTDRDNEKDKEKKKDKNKEKGRKILFFSTGNPEVRIECGRTT